MAEYKSIVYEHGFDRSIVAKFGSVQAADDTLRAVEWVLVRTPDLSIFPLVRSLACGDLRAIKVRTTARSGGLVVLFTYSDEAITFHDAR